MTYLNIFYLVPFSSEPVFSDPAPSFPEPQPPVPPTADLFQVLALYLFLAPNPSSPVFAGDWWRWPHHGRWSFWCSRARIKRKPCGKLGAKRKPETSSLQQQQHVGCWGRLGSSTSQSGCPAQSRPRRRVGPCTLLGSRSSACASACNSLDKSLWNFPVQPHLSCTR